MCGDPDIETSLSIVKALPGAGADVIELGMPFTDPMADGPSIQAAGLRALKAGTTLKKTLDVVRRFARKRRQDADHPDGLLQPDLHPRGRQVPERREERWRRWLILVDMPPEEDEELCIPALKAGLNFIRPRHADDRRQAPAGGARETRPASSTTFPSPGSPAVPRRTLRKSRRRSVGIKRHTQLPVCVGFGIRTAETARTIAAHADGVVVGTALVDAIRGSLDANDAATPKTVAAVADAVASIAAGVRGARQAAE